MTFFTIRPLTPDFLTAVAELDKSCLGGIWSLENYRREMESPKSDLLVLSMMPGSEASSPTAIGVGCVWSILEEAHITILAIAPDRQRQGFGQAMLYQLLVCAWQRGLEWATLEVRVSNTAAISLYKKFGFQDVGRRRRYYQDNDEDALILWHSGLQKPGFETCLQGWKQQASDRFLAAGVRCEFLELERS